jgi:hypothetical protein
MQMPDPQHLNHILQSGGWVDEDTSPLSAGISIWGGDWEAV